MAGSIDGLASGLNTGEIISQLMAIERQGQTRLKTSQTTAQSAIGTLRTLNSRFLAIKTAAEAFTLPTSTGFALASSTSSDPTKATATAKAGAAPGEVSFTASQLATATVSKSSGWVANPSTITVASAGFVLTKNSVNTPVSVGDGSLNSVAKGINDAKAGVTATVLQLQAGQYALHLTSTTTGEDAISISLASFDNGLGQLTSSTGKNALLDVGGTAVTRASNTISDLLPGTTITLLTPIATPVTVRTKSDNAGIADAVAKMVSEVNAAAAEISRSTSYDPATKTAGALNAEGAVRSLRSQLSAAVTGTTTSTPGLVGISVQRDGTVLFNRTKFLEALEKDPAKVQAVIGKDGLATRLADVAKTASAPVGTPGGAGLITTSITNRERTVSRLDDDIKAWDRRLDLREQRLRTQFASLEKAMGAARSQSQWLAGQLAGLNGG